MMRSRKILFILAALATLLTTSCLKDDEGSSGTSKSSFKLTLSVSGSKINTFATIPAVDGEEQINSLWILFFERTSGGTGLFINSYKVAPPSGYPISSGQTIEVNLPPLSGLSNSMAYNMLIVANLEDNIFEDISAWLDELTGKTENEVVATTYIEVIGVGDEDAVFYNYGTRSITQQSIPMSSRAVKEEDQEIVKVELVRAVCRFDVTNNATASGYTLVSASIWNAFPRSNFWSSNFNDFSDARIERFYGIQTPDNEIIGGLYALENFVTRPAPTDNLTTCLILGIENGGVTTFYRVNINAQNFGQQLKRNNSYRVTIQNVLAPGANTERDAYNSSQLSLNITINEWNVDDQGNIQFDGDNILAVPTTRIVFTPLAETREFNIFTLGTGTLEISQSSPPAGITATLVGNLLTVSAEASQDSKAGFIELRFGNLRAVIDISQTGANQPVLLLSSYTIPMFPATAGADVGADGTIVVTSSSQWTAQIFNGSFSFSSGSTVTTTSGNSGDSFTVYTSTVNTNPTPNFAFILVTLTSEPEVSRTIVLSQRGTSAIVLTPSQTQVRFNANGTSIDNNVFSVSTGGDPWEVSIVGANASSFSFVADFVGNTLTVNATQNVVSAALTATLRIRLTNTPTILKDIALSQTSHTISLTPPTVASIAATGGTTPSITVTSSGPWSATITTVPSGVTATLSATSGVSGSTFTVTFPALTVPHITPVATVTVSVTGTSVSQTLAVTQQQLPTRILNFTSQMDYYGTLYPSASVGYRIYIDQWIKSITTTDNFGPTGVVRFDGFRHAQGAGYTAAQTLSGLNLNGGADIYVYTASAIDATGGANILNWLVASDKRVLIANCDINGSTARMGYMGITGTWIAHGGIGLTHTVNGPGLNLANNALYRYLFRDGPFTNGTDISGLVSLRGGDGSEAALSGYASTMIPILMHPSNPTTQMVLGIDPVNRVVWMGNTELFSTRTTEAANNWNNPANVQFLNNLNAWITNAALYGNVFTSQFTP